jgi:hypothetical protein
MSRIPLVSCNPMIGNRWVRMRPGCKERRGRILLVFDRGATPQAGMQRQPGVTDDWVTGH